MTVNSVLVCQSSLRIRVTAFLLQQEPHHCFPSCPHVSLSFCHGLCVSSSLILSLPLFFCREDEGKDRISFRERQQQTRDREINGRMSLWMTGYCCVLSCLQIWLRSTLSNVSLPSSLLLSPADDVCPVREGQLGAGESSSMSSLSSSSSL